MPKRIALIRGVSRALNDCELTFVGREAIDIKTAARQHAEYGQALATAGLEVVSLPADEAFADSVFVEDCAVIFDEAAIVTRPGAESRRGETVSIEAAIREFRASIDRIVAPGTLEGGDVLRIGRRFFVGISSRTNDDGFRQFAAIVPRFGYSARPVRVRGSLHLKTAVTALDDETVILNPEWLETSVFKDFKQIIVPVSEPFGANTLSLRGEILVSSKWPGSRRLIEGAGFTTHCIDISELEKAEAGLTCLSVVFAAFD